MFSRNLGDEGLSADCAECCALHASYVEGCHTLEQVEVEPAADGRIREVRDWVTTSRRSWLAAVQRIMSKPAHTSGGLMAKAPVVKGMLLEVCADNEEAVSITMAFLDDVERLLSQRA